MSANVSVKLLLSTVKPVLVTFSFPLTAEIMDDSIFRFLSSDFFNSIEFVFIVKTFVPPALMFISRLFLLMLRELLSSFFNVTVSAASIKLPELHTLITALLSDCSVIFPGLSMPVMSESEKIILLSLVHSDLKK